MAILLALISLLNWIAFYSGAGLYHALIGTILGVTAVIAFQRKLT